MLCEPSLKNQCRERRPNVIILECFNFRCDGGEVGMVGKVGGWWGWEGVNGGKLVRLGSWERCESGEVDNLGNVGRRWGWDGEKETKRHDGIAIGIAGTFLGDCCWEVQMRKIVEVTIKGRNSL